MTLGQSSSVKEFVSYSAEVLVDVALGVISGILVDTLVRGLERSLHWPSVVLVIVQLFGICLVLYFLEEGSDRLTSSWRGANNYGIVFVTVFLASQSNVVRLVDWVGRQEDHLVRM